MDAIGFEWGAPAIASASMVKEKASEETLQLQKQLEEGNYHRKRKRTPVVSEEVKEEATDELKKETKKANKKSAKGDVHSSNDESSDTGNSSSDDDDSAQPAAPNAQSKKEKPVYVQMWLNKCAELKAYKKTSLTDRR